MSLIYVNNACWLFNNVHSNSICDLFMATAQSNVRCTTTERNVNFDPSFHIVSSFWIVKSRQFAFETNNWTVQAFVVQQCKTAFIVIAIDILPLSIRAFTKKLIVCNSVCFLLCSSNWNLSIGWNVFSDILFHSLFRSFRFLRFELWCFSSFNYRLLIGC